MRFIQISAWNDSGGGFTHRLFDGHPQLRVWPFELLLGRDDFPVDGFDEGWFKGRFRWPRLSKELIWAGPSALFDAIEDAELKSVLRFPQGAKHSDFPLSVSLAAWRDAVEMRWTQSLEHSQASFLRIYIEAFFDLLSGDLNDRRPVLGHCPIAILDAPEMWADFPQGQIVHVVRSPYDGFADMRLRHIDLDPIAYGCKWSLVNGAAAMWAGKRPDQVTLVSLAQIIWSREKTMRFLADRLNLNFDAGLLTPTWRGRPLNEADMGPFGGVPNLTAPIGEKGLKLTDQDRSAISEATRSVAQLLESLDPTLQLEGKIW